MAGENTERSIRRGARRLHRDTRRRTQRRRATPAARPRRRPGPPDRFRVRGLQQTARLRLRNFRRASVLAVAVTGLLLMLWESPEAAGQGAPVPAAAEDEVPAVVPPDDPVAALEQAAATVSELLQGVYVMLPKILVAVVLLILALLAASLIGAVGRRVTKHWEKADALTALTRVVLVLVALGAGLSVIAGDARALAGSLGLAGLALSWALQTPIESFSGWVLNAFRSYYRPGDRIEVGEVFGDVYRIDILTTTVWEAGGPGKSVAGAQPTGAMITFPNWEILRSNIINYTRDFPYVWDEVTIGVANESDLRYTIQVFERTAGDVVGHAMESPTEQYQDLLERARLAFNVEMTPKVYLTLTDAWTDCTIRYLVNARQRRRWASDLVLAICEEMAKPEHQGRIISALPRTIVELADRGEPP